MAHPGRLSPTRTWGSATYDTERGRILYWGGGHCGYGGGDVDVYSVEEHTWTTGNPTPEYPHRHWDQGGWISGLTFSGEPWTMHGRKSYAFDPVSRKMILVHMIKLAAGYNPEVLKDLTSGMRKRAGGLADPPSSHTMRSTWHYDPETAKWELAGGGPRGLDLLATTPRGVIGLYNDWGSRLNDAGYLLPWYPDQPRQDYPVYLYEAAKKKWKLLANSHPAPQNLYEMTSMAYDSRRDQLIVHGGGKLRDELWTFDLKTKKWKHMQPRVAAPQGSRPPVTLRESVYLPNEDVVLMYDRAGEGRSETSVWAYKVDENAWYLLDMAPPVGLEEVDYSGHNRALLYDEKRDLVLLVIGARGNEGQAHVFALRYRHKDATFVTAGK